MNIRLKAGTNKWYPVYTHPRAEKKACEALLKKGIETYLPLRRQLKQWSDRKKWIA
ncbi:MAG TPA: transcription termination/antitermination NusG family protein [Mucilaginibacter sp.]